MKKNNVISVGYLLLCALGTVLTGCSLEPAQAPDEAQLSPQAAQVIEELSPEVAEAEATAPFPAEIKPVSGDAFAAEAEIWDRVRMGFSLPDYSDQPKVAAHVDWHRCHLDFLQRVTARSEPFIHLIVEELERREMPTELALLPVVESAYLPYAYSHGRAAGIWQFIPATGRRFGLKQNWWYDGRRDVGAATLAALDYLEVLHKRFDGDWLLALAAYNAGERKVGNAVAKNKKAGKPTDFWHLKLPRETRNYVPKLLAVKAVVADPEFYGIELWPVPDKPYLQEVELDSQIDLAVAAELAGMEVEELYLLNPGFNRWATDPNGPHRLLLPIDKASAFETQLAELPREARVTWHRHQVRKGETLGHIAQRYSTTVSVLKKSNQLNGSSIRAGSHLLVPIASAPQADYSLSTEERRKAQQADGGVGRKIIHVVQPGDTFWELARQYAVSVRQLAKWNDMAPADVLRPGDRLVIWVPVTAHEASLDFPDIQRSIPGETVRKVRYAVRRGDSLYGIARHFSVEVADIRRWNNMKKRSNLLQPGQRLTLYIDITQTGS